MIWHTEDVLKVIEDQGDIIAFIWLPGIVLSTDVIAVIFSDILGVHYATGHVFDMKTITDAAHKKVSINLDNHYNYLLINIGLLCGI